MPWWRQALRRLAGALQHLDQAIEPAFRLSLVDVPCVRKLPGLVVGAGPPTMVTLPNLAAGASVSCIEDASTSMPETRTASAGRSSSSATGQRCRYLMRSSQVGGT